MNLEECYRVNKTREEKYTQQKQQLLTLSTMQSKAFLFVFWLWVFISLFSYSHFIKCEDLFFIHFQHKYAIIFVNAF